jgi:hypothetical protein
LQEDEQLYVNFQTLRDYERLFKPDLISRGVLTTNHESVVIRRAMQWTKNGEDLKGASAKLSLEELCDRYQWKIVARYGDHFAVVAPCE